MSRGRTRTGDLPRTGHRDKAESVASTVPERLDRLALEELYHRVAASWSLLGAQPSEKACRRVRGSSSSEVGTGTTLLLHIRTIAPELNDQEQKVAQYVQRTLPRSSISP